MVDIFLSWGIGTHHACSWRSRWTASCTFYHKVVLAGAANMFPKRGAPKNPSGGAQKMSVGGWNQSVILYCLVQHDTPFKSSCPSFTSPRFPHL